MAYIGMKYVVAAKLATETPGSPVTYTTGGMVIGKAISGNVTWNRNDNPLRADDSDAENDNSITGGKIDLGLDDLTDDARVFLLGDKMIAGTGDNPATYETGDAAAPYVGFGFIRVRRKTGATTYQTFWFHKAQFGEASEEAKTKGENIEWQTPTLTGRIMGVQNYSTMETNFRQRATFDTEAAARAWLNTKAGIS